MTIVVDRFSLFHYSDTNIQALDIIATKRCMGESLIPWEITNDPIIFRNNSNLLSSPDIQLEIENVFLIHT